MKGFGVKTDELLTAWKTMLRPITEYAVPLWHPGLTDCDSNNIEFLQKKALMFILGCTYIDFKRYYKLGDELLSYEDTLDKLGLTTLKERREVLTNKFAINTARNENHNDMFIRRQSHNTKTRNMFVIEEPFCKTLRYYKSVIPYMSRLLNRVYLPKKKV